MKKLISILLLFICVWCSAQYVNVRKPLRIVYDGDTLDIYFDTDTVNFESNFNFYKLLNGAISVDSIQVNGIWYLDFLSYTFQNGLTESSGTVSLGGSLTGNTSINIDGGYLKFDETSYSNFLKIDPGSISSGYYTTNVGNDVNWDYNTFETQVQDWTNNYYSDIKAEIQEGSNAQINLFITDPSSNEARFDFHTTNGLTITDDIFSKGLVYDADYSTNFTDRSLIDKGFADNNYFQPVIFDYLKQDTSNVKVILDIDDSLKYSVNVYAEMYCDSSAIETTISSADVWYKIGNLSKSNVFENATYTQDTIWIDYDGIYMIYPGNWGASQSVTQEYEVGISINGELPLIQGRSIRGIMYGFDSRGGSPFLKRLYEGDYITIKVLNKDGTDNITFFYGSLTIQKIN